MSRDNVSRRQGEGHDFSRDRDRDRGRGRDRDRNRDRDRWNGNGNRNRSNHNNHPQQHNQDQRSSYHQKYPNRNDNTFGHHSVRDVRHPYRDYRERDEPQEQPVEFALDRRSERINISAARSFPYSQTPSYQRSFYPDNMFGASEEYISKLPPNRRCKPSLGIDEFGNVVNPETEEPIEMEGGMIHSTIKLETNPRPKGKGNPIIAKPIKFLSLDTKPKESNAGPSNSCRIDYGNILSFSHKLPGKGIQERAEQFNIQLRKEPKNINLWKEFVQFQDQVFDETNQVFENEDVEQIGGSVVGRNKKSKAKGKKKALIEKKVAILDKALAANPKCIELHVARLEMLYEIYKPTYVLMEWKKLANVNQELDTFWFEYVRFASTQLQLFTSSSIIQIFEKTFDKFRSMLSPGYQAFQRPAKCHLVLADLLYSICILLKNAGFTERSVAINQAQLEIDFNVPNDVKSKSKEDWKKTVASFEEFWNKGTLRYGEQGSIGWKNHKDATPEQSFSSSFVSDSQVSTFEDEFFSSVTDFELGSSQQKPDSFIWLFVESFRSKLYWVPWRSHKDPIAAEAETCDDSQRIVLPVDVTPFISNISLETYSYDFERQSVYFRHLINFLLTLREDFLPRTHTLDSLLSPFASFALSDSRTLISENYFWKKFLNFYHENSNTNSSSSAKDTCGIPVPEGFRLNEFTVTSHAIELEGTMKSLPKYWDTVEESRGNLLTQSATNHLNFVRSVVVQSLDHLNVKFATTLAQALLRFEQRNICNSKENQKSRMKSAKNLLKHEKLRNSAGTYGELAVLEYFGGSKKKAMELLVKTINSSGVPLRVENSEVDLELYCDLISEVTKLYRLLVELYLRENPNAALSVLISLGNKFSVVDLSKCDNRPTTNELLKAKLFFELVMNWLLPGHVPKTEDEVELDAKVYSKEGPDFRENVNGDKCVELLLQDTNLIVEWTTVYALFRYLSVDFDNANQLYTEVMEKIKPRESLNRTTRYHSDAIYRNSIREHLYVNWSKLTALVLCSNPMQNSKFRNILCKALQEFPSSPALLLLFTDVESQCSIVGKLWRTMLSIVKQDSSQNTVSLHWAPLFMTFALAEQIERLEKDEIIGLDSFGLGGPAVPPDTIFYKMDALFTAAEKNTLTRNVPLIWRVHLKHLVIRANLGKDGMRARALFYDALRHCPSSKALYMDGIAYFPDMTSELSELMVEKGILVRLPKEELDLLMEIDNELENEVLEKKYETKSKQSEVVVEIEPVSQTILNKREDKSKEGSSSTNNSSIQPNKRKAMESDLEKVKPKNMGELEKVKPKNMGDLEKVKPKNMGDLEEVVNETKKRKKEKSYETIVLSDGEIEDSEIVDVSE